MSDEKEYTTFQEMYDFFLSGITDDMFMEMTKTDTEQMLEEILVAAIPHFEFPHWNCDGTVLDFENKRFNVKLTLDEMRIIRAYMIVEWLGFQLANVDLVRQKYSSSDFEFTSQASHMRQLQNMREQYKTEGFHLQRLYSRKEYDENGRVRSSFHRLAEVNTVGKRTDR